MNCPSIVTLAKCINVVISLAFFVLSIFSRVAQSSDLESEVRVRSHNANRRSDQGSGILCVHDGGVDKMDVEAVIKSSAKRLRLRIPGSAGDLLVDPRMQANVVTCLW